MSHRIRLTTNTHENFRTVTITEALRLLAPEGVVVPRASATTRAPLPEGVSPVLAAIASGASDVAWERHVLDPDELLGTLPALYGTASDLAGEIERLEAAADHFLSEDLPHLLRVARSLGGGSPIEALEALLPLTREDLLGKANDGTMLGAKHNLVRLYQLTCSGNGMAPNPAWRCLSAMEAFEHGVRHLRDIHGPVWRGEPRPGEDPNDPWVARRLHDYREDGDRVRMRDVATTASSFAQATTLVTLARRLQGEQAVFAAPALLERLAATSTGLTAPGPR